MAIGKYVVLEPRGLVIVGGADRTDFLQGLVSNDITRVTPERAIWAALLTPQGKYLHDFFVVEIDGSYYLDCESERMMDLGRRLSGYKLRATVDLGIGDQYLVAVLPGADALDGLRLPREPGAAKALGGGVVFTDPRLAELGARAILPESSGEDLLRANGFAPGDLADYDRVRLPLGVPDGSRDLVVEKALLLESNFEELHGLDWEKGCYMGQELTARTKYRGLVKKRLMPVDIEGETPPPGTQISFEGKDAGELRSACEGKGLALIRLEHAEKAFAGEGGLVAGAAQIKPRKPNWARY
jgi:folate-binding protein YgfZ